MLKMYQRHSHAGSSSKFWDENWEGDDFEQSVRFCSIDPLRPLFEKYSKPGDLMLEGGCGLGQYLAYYNAKGRRVVGLDFAQNALKNLRVRQPHLDLCGGDVSRLPFADSAFDVYYSGGVVEHFEHGVGEALAEARRVLRSDGILLISVPYQSPLRSLLASFKHDWLAVDKAQTTAAPNGGGTKFFQYLYKPREFREMLAGSGFSVIEQQGYAILWGLYELPLAGRLQGIKRQTPAGDRKRVMAAVDEKSLIDDRPASLLKRLVVAEEDRVPVLGSGVRLMRWACANMMMYVCRKA